MIGRSVFCAVGALGLTACAATVAPGSAIDTPLPASLAGTRWVGVAEGADPRSLPRLEFMGEGRVTGSTGCNTLSGTWQVEAGGIRMGPMITTKRMCMGPAGEVEQRFLAATNGRILRERGRLVFVSPGGARFEFTPAQAS